MIERLASRQVVLLGIGHTNAHVVRMWRMHAPPDAELVCLSNYSYATYSGMLPALLARQISDEQMEINLAALCNASNARLITDPVIGIDHDHREVQFKDRPSVGFDVLSIGIGSRATTSDVEVAGNSLIPIKPMQSFLSRLEAALRNIQRSKRESPISIAVVGSGVAGTEIVCCLPRFLKTLAIDDYELSMVTRSPKVVPEVEDRTRRLITDVWLQRGVNVITGRAVEKIDDSGLELDDGRSVSADVVVWATGASPPPLLSQLDLELDDRGFIATNHELESVNRRHVFAVGDTGTIIGESLPKAGVYAVRQGPVLWENIQRALSGRPLKPYKPQQGFLKLVNLGNGQAVGQWKGMAFRGNWVMDLKDRIDSKFMDKFLVTPMSNDASDEQDDMQCRGCGCKLGAESLRGALSQSADVEAEDAAPIGNGIAEGQLIASTDFFSAPLKDAYTVGRIAALHSASDIVASGGFVSEALANLVIPEGDPKAQQKYVSDLLDGAKREFDAWDANIVGGHTIVGPRAEVGFTVIGRRIGSRLLRKSNLQPGDRLLLTKPIGIGILLAAQMRSQCPARAYDHLLEAMLQPQHRYAQLAIDLGAQAATDITGFGLMGHLIEMAQASHMTAVLRLDQVPCLPSAIELSKEGIESSLLRDNLCAERDVDVDDSIRRRSAYPLLYDPQTCGGLLIALPERKAKDLQHLCTERELPMPAVIGEVVQRERRGVRVES
ncbi:MAG: selenide, water dikinase SelD [Planctomycetota bacterium]